MSPDDREFERQIRERLRDLALDVSPTEQLLEASRTRARQAAARHRARRLLVPAAAAIVVIAAIAAALVVSSQEPKTHVRPAEPPPTSVKTVPPTTTTTTGSTTTPPTQPPPADPLAGLPDVDVVITPEQRTEGELVYEVPTFSVTIDGEHSAAAQAIEADLAATVDGLRPSTGGHPDEPVDWWFGVTALVSGMTDRTVSVRLNTSYHWAGAAHGGSTATHRTYELATGGVMALSEFFNPDSQYLELIALHTRDRLLTTFRAIGIVQDELSAGALASTEPRVENFTKWAALPEGLEVAFGEYEIGPYAIGQPAVVIPWNDLATALAWRPIGLVPPWAGGESPFPAAVDQLEAAANQQFATTVELRSIRRADADRTYVVGLVVMPNHTVTPMAIRLDGDEPTVVALGTNRFGCDTLPTEVVAQLFLSC